MARGTTESSLDELAKGLANGTLSRGKALRWMGGALLGAALASVPGVAWADDCRRLGRECRRDSQCCSRNCVRRGDDKVCACPQGQDRCNDRCVNLDRNERHCGECFNRCDAGEECVAGECQGEGGCPPGTTECGTQCCQTGETCLQGLACCPTAQVCGTGTSAICCPSAATCVDGFCECDDPDALACGDQCVACEGGTVNSESCLCECPSGTTLIGSTCCPNAQVCATGTTLACCAQGEQCGAGGCGPACVSNGGTCNADTDCCNGFCNSNICASCRSIGGTCTAIIQCCPSTTCEIPSGSVSGTCCIPLGGLGCSTNDDCCSNATTCVSTSSGGICLR
jgi:hypothetical protein